MVYLFLAHCYAIVVAALVAVGPVAAWSNRKTSAEVSEQLCDPRAYHSIPQFPCPSCVIWLPTSPELFSTFAQMYLLVLLPFGSDNKAQVNAACTIRI